MSVHLDSDGADGETIRLDGDCAAQDAETLLTLLQGRPAACVDLNQASHLHAAVLQVLMAFGPSIRLQPLTATADPFLVKWLVPLFAGAKAAYGARL